jgi:hypothetical protein
VCAREFLKGAVSQAVLPEAERNVLDNLGGDTVSRYYRLVATVPLDVVPLPLASEIQHAAARASAKDAHVLAAALRASAPTSSASMRAWHAG